MAFPSPVRMDEDMADTPDTPADRISQLVRWFEDAETQSAPERADAERDRDYADLKQWTKAELEVLEARGQPALTIDYVREKLEILQGMERQRRTDPKAYPRTPKEAERADVATQVLRSVADDQEFDVTVSAVYDNLLVEGIGGADITVEPDKQGGHDIRITHIPWDRLFRDPHARLPDLSDGRFKGVVLWMDKDEAEERFPDAGDALAATFEASSPGTYDDRPTDAWTDNRKTRIRIVQMHYREGKDWAVATFTRAGAVSPTIWSPYFDRKGNRVSSLIIRRSYMDRKNRCYGMVRRLISLQDEVNKRRSKALHWANSRQVVLEQGAVDDVDATRQEMAKPNGVIVKNPGFTFEIQPSTEFTAAQMALLQHATSELQQRGANASMAGSDPRQQSGRAILAQQQGGAVAAATLLDELKQWKRQVFEATWMRARQFWSDERWIRVTDDEQAVKWVGLNRKITLGEMLEAMPPERAAPIAQQMGIVGPNDPQLQQVVKVENEIGDLDADITVEDGPNTPMLDAEQAELLAPLVAQGVVPADALIDVLPLRNKAKLLKTMAQMRETQGKAAQQKDQLTAAQGAAVVRKTTADAEKTETDTTVKKIGIAAMVAGAAPLPGEPVPQPIPRMLN